MISFRIVILVVLASGIYLSGCDNDPEEVYADSGKRESGQIDADFDMGKRPVDKGKLDSDGADDGMDTGVDAKALPSMDAGRDSSSQAPCCACPVGIDEYDDAGVNEYISKQYENIDTPLARFYIFCFTKGIDCEKYTIDIRTLLGLPKETRVYTPGPMYMMYMQLPYSMIFEFPDGEKLPADIDPTGVDELRWDIIIKGASIKYDDSPIPECDGKPIPELMLSGSLSTAEFVKKAADDIFDYVVLKDEQGNVILDTRE
jgi:hypothetical protein